MPDQPLVRLKAGGSPYLEYQNSCMQAAKRTASQSDLTAKGTLTDTARRTVVKTCQETWARMDAGQKGLYLDLYRERRKERAQQLGQAAASRRADSIASSSFSCTSSWGVGSRHCAVHPVMIQQAFQQGQRLPSYSEVYNPDEFYIKDGLDGELLGADIGLDGCPVQRRNVCRDQSDIQAVDRLARILNAMARKVGAVAAASSDLLLMFEGSGLKAEGAPSGRARFFGLLSEASYNPLGQTFTMCEVLGSTTFAAWTWSSPSILRSPPKSAGCRCPAWRRHCASHIAPAMRWPCALHEQLASGESWPCPTP